jgi:hypothetical protein
MGKSRLATILFSVVEQNIYIGPIALEGFGPGQEARMEKTIHIKLDRNADFTLREVLKKIEEMQAEHPELDVFFDGDEYAICSRPRKMPAKH